MSNVKNETTPNNNDAIMQAQSEMRKVYINGSIGVMVSGSMWLIAAIITNQLNPDKGIWALLIGGMMIHPISLVILKILGYETPQKTNNSLEKLALETTFFMLVCIPLALGLSSLHTDWFFKGMLLIIGGRYLTFNTIYGIKLFWILGGVLVLASYLLFTTKASSFQTLLTGAIVELGFGLYLFASYKK